MKTGEKYKRVFIGGPPGSGKSSAGKCLSIRLGVPFMDIDQMVIDRSGLCIPALFREWGEESFRDLETLVLTEVAGLDHGFVTALGGGCLLRSGNLRTVTDSGILLMLSASVDVLIRRCRGKGDERPLASTEEELRELLRSREEHYGSLPPPLDTSDLTPKETAERLLAALSG